MKIRNGHIMFHVCASAAGNGQREKAESRLVTRSFICFLRPTAIQMNRILAVQYLAFLHCRFQSRTSQCSSFPDCRNSLTSTVAAEGSRLTSTDTWLANRLSRIKDLMALSSRSIMNQFAIYSIHTRSTFPTAIFVKQSCPSGDSKLTNLGMSQISCLSGR